MPFVAKLLDSGGSDYVAYHAHCVPQDTNLFIELATTWREGFQELFCPVCNQRLGFYNPHRKFRDVLRLQKIVDETYANAVANGFGEFMRTGDLRRVAVDMLLFSAPVEDFIYENHFSLSDVEQAVENVRSRN